MRPVQTLVALPVLVGLMAGCSPPAGESPATTTAPATTDPGVLSDFLCAADENGVWRGKATLRNIGSAANTYTVRFSVIRSADSEVLGMKEDDFTLEPGASVDVAFPDITTSRASGIECVPHVTAKPAG